MRILFLILYISIFNFTVSLAQSEFKIYVQPSIYNSVIKEKEIRGYKFEEIFIAYGYTIDPKNRNEINLETFRNYLIKVFPNANDTGTLCIDLENKFFTDISGLDLKSKGYERAKNGFLSLIDVVRKNRPNVKVGFYGIPFKMSNKNRESINSISRISEIIKASDILFPTLYLNYSEDELNGAKRNSDFIKLNLELALSLGLRYDKEVIPFTWYMVHPFNKSYGTQIISPDEWSNYIEKIKAVRANGRGVNAIIYWEPNAKNFKLYRNKKYNKQYSNMDQNQIFIDNIYNNAK